jgi:Fe-S-cluster-containing hydrogenase component 2
MINAICKKNCAGCFALPVCAVGAIIEQQNSIYVDTDKCIGCGSCRTACVTFGYNQALKEKTVEWLKGAA